MSLDILAQRATNAAGVSVGTSLALETILPSWPIFDPKREAPKPENLLAYKRVWINLATMFRNLYNCCESSQHQNLRVPECTDALFEEMETIHKFIQDTTQGSVEVHFYHCDYKDLNKAFPEASIRPVVTPKQIFYKDLATKVLERVIKLAKINNKTYAESYQTKLSPKSYGNTLIMTHFPVDLLSESRFGSLKLLESHTGLVKNKNQWHTKLYNGKSLSIIPFCNLTIQVFGDDYHFRPMDNKIRSAILEIAERHHWSWMTTNSKIRQDVRSHPDQFFSQLVIGLM